MLEAGTKALPNMYDGGVIFCLFAANAEESFETHVKISFISPQYVLGHGVVAEGLVDPSKRTGQCCTDVFFQFALNIFFF